MNKTSLLLTTMLFFSVNNIKTMNRFLEWHEKNEEIRQPSKQQREYESLKNELGQLQKAQKGSQLCSSPQVLFLMQQAIGWGFDFVCPANPSTLVKTLNFFTRALVPLGFFAGGKLTDNYFSEEITKLEKKIETKRPPTKLELLIKRVNALETEVKKLKLE